MDTEKLAYQAFRARLQRALSVTGALLAASVVELHGGNVAYVMRRQRGDAIETFTTMDIEAAVETACEWGYDYAGFSVKAKKSAHGT